MRIELCNDCTPYWNKDALFFITIFWNNFAYGGKLSLFDESLRKKHKKQPILRNAYISCCPSAYFSRNNYDDLLKKTKKGLAFRKVCLLLVFLFLNHRITVQGHAPPPVQNLLDYEPYV